MSAGNPINRIVAIYRHGSDGYSSEGPFHPDTAYPEYPFPSDLSLTPSPAYECMRNIFHLLRLDPEHFETPHWNPLGELISPGDHVLLKPNLIRESHLVRHEEWEQIITHPSLIRAVLDYVFIALKRSGFVTIADGPQTDSRFEEIKHRIQLESIVDFYRRKGLNVRALDLRQHHWLQKEGVTYKRLKLAGDPWVIPRST